MSIETAIQNAQQKVANAYTAVDNKGGTLPATQNLANLPNAIDSIQTGGDITALTITPSKSQQTFSKAGATDGYNPITVDAVTSAIDSNIQAKFIRNGVEILGVTGSYGNPVIDGYAVCSAYRTLYINDEGFLYNCGYTANSSETTFIQKATNVKQVICAKYTALYITNDGTLYNVDGAQEATNVKQVACSYDTTTTWYVNNDGVLYGRGMGGSGQQGNGSASNVTTFTQRATNVKQIACSQLTTWYVTNDGVLYGCGYGGYGQQSNGSTSNVTTFTQRATNVKQAVCSNETTWYVTNDGELYGCGMGGSGQQGNGSTSNVTTFTQRAIGL